MSIVGPRPLLPKYLPIYPSFHGRRNDVLPGFTGGAHLNGRNALTWEDKFNLDIWYVEHQSMRLDTHIIWKTVAAVLQRTGIEQVGHATMPEFLGSAAHLSATSTDTLGQQKQCLVNQHEQRHFSSQS
jgi:hypothetical protein